MLVQRMSFYLMVSKNESGFVSHFPDLVGLRGIEQKKRIEDGLVIIVEETEGENNEQ